MMHRPRSGGVFYVPCKNYSFAYCNSYSFAYYSPYRHPSR